MEFYKKQLLKFIFKILAHFDHFNDLLAKKLILKHNLSNFITILKRRVKDFNMRAKEKLGSPDFESGALPLCQLSELITIYL